MTFSYLLIVVGFILAKKVAEVYDANPKVKGLFFLHRFGFTISLNTINIYLLFLFLVDHIYPYVYIFTDIF